MKKTAILLFLIILMQTPAYCEISPDKLQVYYQNGVVYLKDKKYSSSIIELKKVIRQRPYDRTVRNTLALAYMSRGQYYVDTERNYPKGINDLRSALVYAKMWDEANSIDSVNIPLLEEKLNKWTNTYAPLQNDAAIFAEGKSLRGQGELASAIYVYSLLYNKDKTASKEAYSTNSDIYKSLNNQKMAIDCIKKAISIKPDDGMLHFKYALIYDDIENEDAAMDEYSLALKYSNGNKELLSALENLWMARTVQNPSDSQALINLGAIFQKEEKFDLAKAQYIKARLINPNDPVILLNLASLYTQEKDYDNGIKIYNEILAKNPNDTKIKYYKAKLYEEKQDFSSAVQEYQEILKAKPDYTDAKESLNNILSNMTKEQLAKYLLSEAQKNPQSYDAQFKYAFEMHKNKGLSAAIEYYKKALAINPKHVEPYINLGQIYISQNNTEEANLISSKGLSYFPDNSELLKIKDTADKTNAGKIWEKAGEFYNNKDYSKALEYYLKISYQSAETYTMIANCYWEIKEYDKALEYYNKVLELNQNDENSLFMIANILITLKRNDDAKSYLTKILRINPNNVEAKNTLHAINEGEEGKLLENAIAYYENKSYDNALDTLNALIAINPKSAYAYYYKGAIYDDLKEPDKALEQYKKSIAADVNFALGYYMTATTLDNKENFAEAVKYYEKYLALKEQEQVHDEYTTYTKDRIKELKEYLSQK